MKLIITMIQGFCMALADSVPGVSGGTIAFIMGFYDKFIGSIHDIAFKKKKCALFSYQARIRVDCWYGIGCISIIFSI